MLPSCQYRKTPSALRDVPATRKIRRVVRRGLLRYQNPSDAVMRIINACRVGDVARVSAHLNAGGDPNLFGLHRRTLLHVAASHGRENIWQLLIAHGAIVHQKDQYGITPLQIFNTSNDTG